MRYSYHNRKSISIIAGARVPGFKYIGGLIRIMGTDRV
jgi:hypothetical protein